MTGRSWKQEIIGRAPEAWAREIDIFETQIDLRKRGKIEEKLFAETRLRRGVYGQRYDNGQRHDGEQSQKLEFPNGELTKGPVTMWDAPGMSRIKIPYGRLTAEQLEVLCEVAEEYSDQILHVTTRQDIQLHFIHIEDTPDMMRRLASVGITTREACGNSVRNITACPLAGVCNEESFDVAPYADAMTFFLLGHDDVQDFGRKFKIAFSGCKQNPCGLTNFHDLGLIAAVRTIDGKKVRGFEFYVGGGLGAVPYPAKLVNEFCTEEELFPLTQAVCRVFAKLGEKANRSRARIKFLVNKLGLEEFTRLVNEERQTLRPDPRWTKFLQDLHKTDEIPLRPAGLLPPGPYPEGFEAWRKSSVRPQRQAGYVTAIVKLPLGDFTPDQGRSLAALMRKYTGDSLRTTVDQNLLFRWVSEADVVALYEGLKAIGLGDAGAESIDDITSCPGTDTCKLGISSSRGLAAELKRRLEVAKPEGAENLHIKCSGCFNSCGQHHVADIGFLGVSRNVNGRRVPHFQLVVGGQWTNNGGSYGLAIGAVPSKRVPEVVERLTTRYAAEKQGDETFRGWIDRIGKREVRKIVDEFASIPLYEVDSSYYSDWKDPREYTIGDIGVGECAGEVVSLVEVGLAAAERELFESQVLLDDGNAKLAADRATNAMLTAARALTKQKNLNLSEDADEIVSEFKKFFYDTEIFFDPFSGGRFAQYLFRAHDEGETSDAKAARQRLEEAQLFVDASHQCYVREGAKLAASAPAQDAAPTEQTAE
jgi:sulfite reductase (ferredoxin)